MGSSTVKAQKLANETNLQIAQETNDLRKQIADAQNELNYQMFNEQNAWNLQRRDEEWAHNDPSAQMERLIMAGINPISAIGSISSGEAQQLTSASPQAAVGAELDTPHVIPEDGAIRDLGMLNQAFGNLNASAANALNGYVALKSLNQGMKESDSRINLNEYESALKATQKSQIQIANEQNVNTFDTRLKLLNQTLRNYKAEYANTKQNTENAKALLNNINAQNDLIRSSVTVNQKQVDMMEAQIQQGWKQLSISQQNANTSASSVNISRDQYELDVKKFKADIQKLNNDEIFRWLDKFSPRSSATGTLSGGAQFGDFGIKAGGSYTTSNEANVQRGIAAMRAANIVMYDRVLKDPSEKNQQAYSRSSQLLMNSLKLQAGKSLPVDDVPIRTPPTWNVENPSGF